MKKVRMLRILVSLFHERLSLTLLSAQGPQTDHLEKMTAVQLKALCKEQGLKVSGKKADLQDRLREHFLTFISKEPEDEFDAMSDEDLKATLVGRGLPATGTREYLLEELRADIKFTQDLQNAVPVDDAHGYRTIGEALEAVAMNGGATHEILSGIRAKSAEKPRYIDVKIKSLGMTPLKETAGGAPGVTADVLRDLAGDPFENPPKYGKVSDSILGDLTVTFLVAKSSFPF